MSKDKVVWPGWRFGPDGQSELFNNADEVPEGWTDNPNDFIKGKKTEKAAPEQPTESPYKDKTDAEIIAELKSRKIEFGEKWPRPKLEKLLIEDDNKKKGK